MYSKEFVLALFLSNTSARYNSNYQFDLNKAAKITEGVLRGALQAEGLDNLTNCLTEVETIGYDAEEAIQDFEKKTKAGVFAGIKEVGKML